MDKVISAADANRAFSRLLRDVRDGESYTVTSHGRPVARLVPVIDAEKGATAKEVAYQELMARLRSQPVLDLGRVTRDEMNERGR